MRAQLLCEADVILALDWMDLGGALRQAKNVGTVTAKIIACSLDQNLHTGANMEYQALPTVDVLDGDDRRRRGRRAQCARSAKAARSRGRRRCRPRPKQATAARSPWSTSRRRCSDQFNDPENVTFCTLGRGWPFDVWPLQNGMSYLGKDGGGGLGSGPGISVGSALALHHKSRAATRSRCSATATSAWARRAIWTAVQHRIPLLVIDQQQPLLLQ